jgi:hypothetical protein
MAPRLIGRCEILVNAVVLFFFVDFPRPPLKGIPAESIDTVVRSRVNLLCIWLALVASVSK